MEESAKNGFGVGSWTDTNEERFLAAARRAKHKNQNGGNGKSGMDQNWVNSLGMHPDRKDFILKNI